jgi:hypothetical protein
VVFQLREKQTQHRRAQNNSRDHFPHNLGLSQATRHHTYNPAHGQDYEHLQEEGGG